VAVAATLALAACGGDEEQVRTVTVRDGATTKPLERFAYAEMKAQARKTCAVVPRDVLIASFRRVSGDRESYLGRRRLTDNDIGLMYVEDVKISPIPMQRAAYDGCLEGLADARR
jgi:hypothetical protein